MKGLRSPEGPNIPRAEPTPAFAGSDQQVLYDGFVIKNQGHQAVAQRPERRLAEAPTGSPSPARKRAGLEG
jgi:hypothetical protein